MKCVYVDDLLNKKKIFFYIRSDVERSVFTVELFMEIIFFGYAAVAVMRIFLLVNK